MTNGLKNRVMNYNEEMIGKNGLHSKIVAMFYIAPHLAVTIDKRNEVDLFAAREFWTSNNNDIVELSKKNNKLNKNKLIAVSGMSGLLESKVVCIESARKEAEKTFKPLAKENLSNFQFFEKPIQVL